jgi:hypothetical protein
MHQCLQSGVKIRLFGGLMLNEQLEDEDDSSLVFVVSVFWWSINKMFVLMFNKNNIRSKRMSRSSVGIMQKNRNTSVR